MGTVREVSEMSRYIDADALIMALRLEYPMMPMFKESRKEWEIKTEGYRKAEEVINDAPSIDIVRCKECRHWIGETEHYEDREYKACWQLCGQYTDSEFWCKYGEREGE